MCHLYFLFPFLINRCVIYDAFHLLGSCDIIIWLDTLFPGLRRCYHQENWSGFDLWPLWRAADSRPVQHGCWEAWWLSRWSGILVWVMPCFCSFFGLLFDMSLHLLTTEWLHWIIFLWSCLGTRCSDKSFDSCCFLMLNDLFHVKFFGCIPHGTDYDFHVSPTDL